MEIRVQSIKFNADQKLLDFVEKKVSKLPKFYDGITDVDLIIERNAKTFEDAVVDCVDILKDKLVRAKEKKTN